MASRTPINKEANFQIDELFFSITDKRGIIQTGNSIFSRVSGFARTDLIGAPHNIIRHPDMPKLVFKTLWDGIQAGKSIIAYVKNMAQDGSYYWVVASVAPVPPAKPGSPERYLSVRFKPSSELFKLVPDLYRQLVEAEKQGGVAKSGEALGNALQAKDFDGYEGFMRALLIEEMKSKGRILEERKLVKQTGLDRKLRDQFRSQGGDENAFLCRLIEIYQKCASVERFYGELFGKLDDFLALRTMLLQKSAFMRTLAAEIRFLSLNAAIESERMDTMGKTLSVVAQEMEKNSEDSERKIREIAAQITEIIGELQEITFQISQSKLQVEMITFFSLEYLQKIEQQASFELSPEEVADLKDKIVCLLSVLGVSSVATSESMGRLTGQLLKLTSQIDQLETCLVTVEFIHMSGKIETARIPEAATFNDLFGRVLELVKKAKGELHEFKQTVLALHGEVGRFQGAEASSSSVQTIRTLRNSI